MSRCMQSLRDKLSRGICWVIKLPLMEVRALCTPNRAYPPSWWLHLSKQLSLTQLRSNQIHLRSFSTPPSFPQDRAQRSLASKAKESTQFTKTSCSQRLIEKRLSCKAASNPSSRLKGRTWVWHLRCRRRTEYWTYKSSDTRKCWCKLNIRRVGKAHTSLKWSLHSSLTRYSGNNSTSLQAN